MPAQPIVYLNGKYLPRCEATFDIEDRGALFADGVYEVLRYFGGKPFLMQAHVDRLHNSCSAIELPVTDEIARLAQISDELVHRNGLTEAVMYWHISRGVGPRKHSYDDSLRPTVLVMASPAHAIEPGTPPRTGTAITVDDTRWSMCWIKSLMLLPNAMAKTQATRAGADEAIFTRKGVLIEGSSTSLLLVRGGTVHTYPLDGTILPSVTRQWLLDAARRMDIPVAETPLQLNDLSTVDEAFICGTSTMVLPMAAIDGRIIGDGRAGPITMQLHQALVAAVLA